MQLVASVFSAAHAERSLAVLKQGRKQTSRTYREGMSVGDHQVVAVLPKATYLRKPSGRLCSVGIFAAVGPKPVSKHGKKRQDSAAKRDKPRQKKTGSKLTFAGLTATELERKIQKVAKHTYRVDRTLVDKVLRNPRATVRRVRLVSKKRRGRIVGSKLYGIRRHSILARLGLKSGDLLRTINGYDLGSLDSALEAYKRLRNADHITIALDRKRRRLHLDYQIM